jgi:ribulose-phosphate 3-epimerase
MGVLIAPSLLSANFLNLEKDLRMLEASEADWIHLDIMDGVFVPNISFGFPLIEQIRKVTSKPLDVHLMIVDPDRYLTRFRDAGASSISVHYETCNHLHRSLNTIRTLGCKAGVVLNPHTPVHFLEDILPEADFVLLMSVNPGFGGQSFIPSVLKKISKLKSMILAKGLNTLIEVDGGVGPENSRALAEAGADILVAGNAVFRAENPSGIISAMKMAL